MRDVTQLAQIIAGQAEILKYLITKLAEKGIIDVKPNINESKGDTTVVSIQPETTRTNESDIGPSIIRLPGTSGD